MRPEGVPVISLCDIPKTRRLDGAGPSLSCCGTASHTPTGSPSWIVISATVVPQLGREPHLSLTQGDGSTALGTAVVLAVQPRLRADVQLILSLVTNLGADTGFGDEVQALAVTAVITPCSRETSIPLKSRGVDRHSLGWPSVGLLCTHTPSDPSTVLINPRLSPCTTEWLNLSKILTSLDPKLCLILMTHTSRVNPPIASIRPKLSNEASSLTSQLSSLIFHLRFQWLYPSGVETTT